MALHVVRFEHKGQVRWGVVQNGHIISLNVECTSTSALLELGYDGIHRTLQSHGEVIESRSAKMLSPITTPTKVMCQGANYRQHMIDSGMNPDAKNFNMFFTKSSASVTGPSGEIIKPAHVNLLDYEIELTLVLGKRTAGPVEVTASNLHEYVAGICIGNDISARDIQIPEMQFHKGKSYRTFCPLGPVLCLLDANEMHYVDELDLELCVNGEVRQKDSSSNLVYKPAETLTEMSMIHDFEPGDVLMTGTPSGCALHLPSPTLIKLTSLLPDTTRWDLFRKSQSKSSKYLQPGDVVESTIKSMDGHIDLGYQCHVVAEPEAPE